MKKRKSRVLCLIIIYIVLFLGICSQIEKADSLLVSLHHMTQEETIEKIASDYSYISKGTNKLIRGLGTTIDNLRRERGRGSVRSSESFLAVRIGVLPILFICLAVITGEVHTRGSTVAILKYIHDQDGEK